MVFALLIAFQSLLHTYQQPLPDRFHKQQDSLETVRLTLRYPQDAEKIAALTRAYIHLQTEYENWHGLSQSYIMYGRMFIDQEANLDSCLYYVHRADSLLSHYPCSVHQAKSHLVKAWYYSIVNDTISTKLYLGLTQRSLGQLDTEEAYAHNSHYLLNTHFQAGTIYQAINHYNQALSEYYQALEYAQAEVDTFKMARCVASMAEMHYLLGDHDKATDMFHKVLAWQHHDLGQKLAAAAYNFLGEMAMKRGAPSQAHQALTQCLTIVHREELPPNRVYMNLGRLLANEGKPDSAFYYLNLVDTAHMHYRFRTLYYLAQAEAHYSTGNVHHAVEYGQKAMLHAQQEADKMRQRPVMVFFVNLYRDKGQYKEAFQHQAALAALDKQLMDESKQRAMTELEASYEVLRKEQQIVSLGQENAIKDLMLSSQRTGLFALASGALVVGLVGLLVFQKKQYAARKKEISLEQTLLRTQMNPHFIFNALASIQNAVLDKETRKATLYLAQFGELTRDILEASRRQLIPLSQELNMVQNYFDLEQVRFDKKLTLTIETGSLSLEGVLVPPLLLQPLVENTIKHGFSGQTEGHVWVRMQVQQNVLRITVEDNGKGLPLTPILSSNKTSLALEILQDRINQLFPKGAPQPPFRINNRKTASGVIVTLLVPYQHA